MGLAIMNMMKERKNIVDYELILQILIICLFALLFQNIIILLITTGLCNLFVLRFYKRQNTIVEKKVDNEMKIFVVDGLYIYTNLTILLAIPVTWMCKINLIELKNTINHIPILLVVLGIMLSFIYVNFLGVSFRLLQYYIININEYRVRKKLEEYLTADYSDTDLIYVYKEPKNKSSKNNTKLNKYILEMSKYIKYWQKLEEDVEAENQFFSEMYRYKRTKNEEVKSEIEKKIKMGVEKYNNNNSCSTKQSSK